MKADGTMARHDDLAEFSEEYGIHMLSIADLIQYRMRTERLVRRTGSGPIVLGTGATWTAHSYGLDVDQRQFLALVLGEVDASPTIVRVHTGSVLGDVFGVRRDPRVHIGDAVNRIEAEGRGVILFLPGSLDLQRDLAFHTGEAVPPRKPADQGLVLREYGLGAQVLADLGVRQIRLLTNRPRRLAGLEGYGLEVVEQLLLFDEAREGEVPRTTH
jgi:3,4-dihydroxy 2-butanone 4-phosphate synthase/GTP cyclohydrolase II